MVLVGEPRRSGLTYWILIGYLAVSVGLMSWAARRWAHRSRVAYLVAPLVFVATVITFVAI